MRQQSDPPSVLIVDDHRANLVATEAVLAPLDARIVTASSGEEALKLMLTEDFALILMDVHMPVLDGYETLALIREREKARHIPAIFLTAVYNDAAHVRRGYELGALDYITKPFDPDVLRAKATALLSSYRRAQAAERRRREDDDYLKDLFVGIVGHDLRTPLGAIQLATNNLRLAPEMPALFTKQLDRINRSALRMQEIIANLLDLTRGRLGGGIPVTRGHAELDVICHAVIDELQGSHPHRELQLSCTGPLTGEWDSARLTQVVSNLVANALKHSDVDPIVITAIGDEETASLTVHNRGAPIPRASLRTLFEPFGPRGESRDGLGLGLYIVREIVRAHGGTVEATSTVEDGTTFTVRLPRREVSPPASQPPG